MRVLQVSHAIPPATYGGTELYTRDLAETLASEGHTVAIAVPHGTDDATRKADHKKPDIEVFELPGFDDETALEVNERPLDAVVRPSVDNQFRRILADWKPDVVRFQHFKHLSATLPTICKRRGVPCLATLHDFWTICHREQLYRPEGRPCSGPESVEKCTKCYRLTTTEDNQATVENEPAADGGVTTHNDSAIASVARRDDALRDALSATDKLVAPSVFLRETFVKYGIPPESIEQCRNGIQVQRFEDTGFDPDSSLQVGYAGRITERKGVHLLVKAASEIEDVSLHLFGRFEPPSEDYHAKLDECADGEVTFHGRYADRATPYCNMDVLVLPSIWYENSPLVIQEAFASGVPVVTSDVGGMAEMVRDGEDGLTFPVGDSEALADELARLANSLKLVTQLRDGVTEPRHLRNHTREITDLYAKCTTRRE